MTDDERNEALDECGREVADLFPGQHCSVTFDIKDGKLAGIRQQHIRRPTTFTDRTG